VVARLTPAVSRPAPVYTNQSRPGNQGQFNRGGNNSPAVNNNRGQFNGAQPTTRPNNPPVNTDRGNNPPEQSRDGFRPFTPPANNSQQPYRGGNVQPNNQQQRQNQQQPQSEARPQQQQLQQHQQEQQVQQQQQQQQEQRQYRYTSPQKARDGNYDVHPPLNQRQEQTARPQQQEQTARPEPPRQQAQPKQEERRENNKQDNKKDKQN
jgi:hypothetical protein